MYSVMLLAVVVVAGLFVAPPKAQAMNDVDIQRSMQRGIAYLKGLQQKDGSWGRTHKLGMTALAGLALLECGVPVTDPAVQKAAGAVRLDCYKTGPSLWSTYRGSTLLLFLDRLGDPADEPLIDALVYWLLTGQSADGTWGYSGPRFPVREALLLRNYLELLNQPVLGEPKAKEQKEKAEERKEKMKKLGKEICDRIKELASEPRKPFRLGPTDHSNTQFAVLALWAGRRHGMPVDGALKDAERHFLSNQKADGTWNYLPNRAPSDDHTPANTCNGLLALAIGQALSGKALAQAQRPPPEPRTSGGGKQLARDAPGQLEKAATEEDKIERGRRVQMEAGLAALARFIAEEVATRRGLPPVVLAGGKTKRFLGGNFYAFLWSLAKLTAAYDLKTLGGLDWYRWGAGIVLVNQAPNGSWNGGYEQFGGADTCFALLFLSKSNVTKDLTVKLKGYIKSPGNGILPAPDNAPEGKKKPPDKAPAKPDKGPKKAPDPVPPNRKE